MISFKIENKFKKWPNIFDFKEGDRRHYKLDIKQIFRDYSKDFFPQVICINYPLEGNIQEFLKVNSLLIKIHKLDLSSRE